MGSILSGRRRALTSILAAPEELHDPVVPKRNWGKAGIAMAAHATAAKRVVGKRISRLFQ
jgi:hypothetical protein